jgi:hypothetical protein
MTLVMSAVVLCTGSGTSSTNIDATVGVGMYVGALLLHKVQAASPGRLCSK